MFHVGLDIHTKHISICALSETGQVAHRSRVRSIEEMMLILKGLLDRNDAERLAKLLYLGETPTVHVPSLEVRTWRELINCRSQVIAKRTRARDLLLEEIETLIRQVRRIEQQLNRQAQQSSAVAQLRSIPGVGIRTAEAVAAFVDDPHRFRNAKAVGAYFGLVPCQDQSGDKNRLGHITREGAPVVRQLAAEAAWQALRRSPTVRAYFE